MAMAWTTLEAALNGAHDASAVLDALTASSMADIQETLDKIGVGEAGPPLSRVQAAEPTERRSNLAASLNIIDQRLAADAPVTKRRLWFSSTQRWSGDAAHSGDMARSALLAALIAAELGGDPEAQRSRLAAAATAFEVHLATQRDRLTKSAYNTEATAGRQVLLAVFRLSANKLKPRRAG